MDEANDNAPEMPGGSHQQSSQTLGQNGSPLGDTVKDKFKATLTKLEALPFKDEKQKTSFLEKVRRLEEYHVIQVFNLGVVPLQNYMTDSPEFVEEVTKLFEICFSFCYTADVTKIVAFDFYAKALKFCFPPLPKRCLSTEVLSVLLELVLIIQEGKLASIVLEKAEQVANPKVQISGATRFFEELLAIFENRRDGGRIKEIVDETLKFASADAERSCIETHVVQNVALRSDHLVSPVFLTNWMTLLKLVHVSNGFASALAKMGKFLFTTQVLSFFYPLLQTNTAGCDKSAISDFLSILEEIKTSGSEIKLPSDEVRLNIFFKRLNQFCLDRKMMKTSVKLLATTSISNKVLEEILDQFCCKDAQPAQPVNHFMMANVYTPMYSIADFRKARAFDLVFKVLLLFPDGELVNKVLKFWNQTFSFAADYESLAALMELFVDESPSGDRRLLEGRAERTLKFLEGHPRSILSLLTVWQPFLLCFIKLFPNSFQCRSDVSAFIQKALEISNVPAEERKTYFDSEQRPPLRFLEWMSQKSFTEERTNEMIGLLKCCIDSGSLGPNWEFSIHIIKQLSLCQQLPFSSTKSFLQDLNSLAKQFEEQDKRTFQDFVEKVTLNESLEFKDEILSETLDLIKRFFDKDRTSVLQLLSWLSATDISGDRRVKLLQKSKESSKGLLNSIHILELTSCYYLRDGVNEYSDLLYTAVVDILKEEEDLCSQFYGQQLRYSSMPFHLQKVWVLEVAKLVSLGSFKEEIDYLCCLPVIREVPGIVSESEILQILGEVRATAERLLNDIRGRDIITSSPDAPNHVLGTFVSCLKHVLRSVVFSSEEKLLLVQKVCEMFLSSPDILTEQGMEYALSNLIPLSRTENDGCPSNQEEMRLRVDQIVVVLENPIMMANLSRIPNDGYESLCTVLSTMNSNSFSKDRLMDIYHFIGSQNDLDERFFVHFLSILQVAIQNSTCLRAVLEILRELICIIRITPAELIPLTMLNFEYLLQNQVEKHERERFVKDVIMKWDFSPNASILSYLKVPQLLWKVYTTADCRDKIIELTNRAREILKKVNEREEISRTCKDALLLPGRYRNKRRISCCELEWLVFHCSLSSEEAALACDLIFSNLEFSERLRCFTSSVVQIEDVCFTLAPEETLTGQVSAIENESAVTESQNSTLTPVFIAQKMIRHLRRLLGKEEDLTEAVYLLWNLLFAPQLRNGALTLPGCAECGTGFSYLDDEVEVFLSILAATPSTEVLLFWAKLNMHHVSQCSEVILKACKKIEEAESMAKEESLSFHTAVYNSMNTIREGKPTKVSSFYGLTVHHFARCFRLVKLELRHLSNMIGSSLPIDVTLAVLDLFQVNVQAGVSVSEIVSSWSSKQQASELVKSVQLCCQEKEMSSLNAAQSEFVWQLAEAHARLYKNSPQDLLNRLRELTLLYDPEDTYGLNRLPKWRLMMIADGFSVHAIDCWCVAFLMTPLEDLTSRDVDAIVDLNCRSLQLVSSVCQEIKTCIFPEEGFQVMRGKGIKESQTKERLRLARLLGEFINVLKKRKSEENPKDAVIRKIVVDACDELCRAHLKKNRRNDVYKIHEQKLKALFTEVFGKQRKTHDEAECAGMLKLQADEDQLKVPSSVARQSSYLHENLPPVLNDRDVYERLLVLLRRWLSGIAIRPVLAFHTREVVQLLFSIHSSEERAVQIKELHGAIEDHILSLENNQALIANLQAAGYNQGRQGSLNLWSSPSVECAGYLSKTESADNRRFEKKLTEVLRRLWNEWRDILLELDVEVIKVGEAVFCTDDIFGRQDSLKEMEEQVSAVKERLSKMTLEDRHLERRVEQLKRQEQRHRASIKKLYKSKVRNG